MLANHYQNLSAPQPNIYHPTRRRVHSVESRKQEVRYGESSLSTLRQSNPRLSRLLTYLQPPQRRPSKPSAPEAPFERNYSYGVEFEFLLEPRRQELWAGTLWEFAWRMVWWYKRDIWQNLTPLSMLNHVPFRGRHPVRHRSSGRYRHWVLELEDTVETAGLPYDLPCKSKETHSTIRCESLLTNE